MSRRQQTAAGASDTEVRRLLDQHGCPTPFHAVRTRFLGSIASPALSASPLDQVKALWGGRLPEFEDVEAANELIGALVMGLWNRLTAHQERKHPFRLIRFDVPQTPEGLEHMARVRREEIEGFVEGLFGSAEALSFLSEIRAMLEGVRRLAADWSKPASAADLAGTLRNVQELTRIAEQEIHAAVLSCARARRSMSERVQTTKPTLH